MDSLVIAKKASGILMIAIGLTFFLIEHKSIPHNPKNPEKWDAFHKKFFGPIKMSARVFLLLGLTFLIA